LIDAEESKTEDIYEGAQRDEMLEDDEIAAAEDGFTRGRDMAMKEMEEERKKGRKPLIRRWHVRDLERGAMRGALNRKPDLFQPAFHSCF
jgi:hypothetical protein